MFETMIIHGLCGRTTPVMLSGIFSKEIRVSSFTAPVGGGKTTLCSLLKRILDNKYNQTGDLSYKSVIIIQNDEHRYVFNNKSTTVREEYDDEGGHIVKNKLNTEIEVEIHTSPFDPKVYIMNDRTASVGDYFRDINVILGGFEYMFKRTIGCYPESKPDAHILLDILNNFPLPNGRKFVYDRGIVSQMAPDGTIYGTHSFSRTEYRIFKIIYDIFTMQYNASRPTLIIHDDMLEGVPENWQKILLGILSPLLAEKNAYLFFTHRV